MCIICIKKMGVQFPTIKQVQTMCDNNPDGFSMVIGDGKHKPEIIKTLDEKKFLKIYKMVLDKYNWETSSMYIHARIKTHGTMKIENCHGWKENGLIFAHNGILSIRNRGDLTDSETYFRDIFSPAYRIGGWKMAEKTIDAIIGTSKFVFMDNLGNIKHYGQYIEDCGGLLFSNTSYQTYKRVYQLANYGYNHYGFPSYQKTKSSIDDWQNALIEDWGDEDTPF